MDFGGFHELLDFALFDERRLIGFRRDIRRSRLNSFARHFEAVARNLDVRDAETDDGSAAAGIS